MTSSPVDGRTAGLSYTTAPGRAGTGTGSRGGQIPPAEDQPARAVLVLPVGSEDEQRSGGRSPRFGAHDHIQRVVAGRPFLAVADPDDGDPFGDRQLVIRGERLADGDLAVLVRPRPQIDEGADRVEDDHIGARVESFEPVRVNTPPAVSRQ